VKSENRDEALLAGHRSSITKNSAAKAFDALIAAATSLRGYETEPAWQGKVRIFKYVDPVANLPR
jgi:hypothetical protein